MLNWFKRGSNPPSRPESNPPATPPSEPAFRPPVLPVAPVSSPFLPTLDASASPVTPQPAPAPPQPLDLNRIGSYRILRRLGEGGMGKVYLVEFARDDESQDEAGDRQLYALKALTYNEDETDAEHRERFRREILIGLTLNHPNVCRMVDWGFHEDNSPYIVMELLDGIPLSEYIKTTAPLSLAESRRLVMQLLRGLGAIHAVGVVHRDLKPQNIFLTTDGVVKIMDFGIARKVGQKNITTTGTALGTPSFISPEQLLDTKRVDHRTDIFNVGLIFYQMLTKRLPFEGSTLSATVKKILQGHVTPITYYRDDLPPETEQWLARLMMKNREARFQSAREALEAIRF
ncbi:MAG TPA: protein kinase [Candidatus Xenobia bacterium]